MNLSSFFESIFCGAKIAEIKRLKEKNSDLSSENNALIRDYKSLMSRYDNAVQACTEDKLHMLQQIQDLTSLLSSSVELPDISSYVDTPILYRPFEEPIDIPLGIIADEYYYAFTLEQWKDILTEIQEATKTVLKKWKTNISDCDDWALVLNGFSVTAFVKAGLDKQGALLFVRSQTHAYNLFITHDETDGFIPYIYEPQNNTVVGKLSEVDWEPYITTKGWLLGAELPPF